MPSEIGPVWREASAGGAASETVCPAFMGEAGKSEVLAESNRNPGANLENTLVHRGCALDWGRAVVNHYRLQKVIRETPG